MIEVKVDEMLGLVRDVTSEVSSNNAVPGRVILPVKLLLDVSCDVFLDAELLYARSSAVDSVLLHVV